MDATCILLSVLVGADWDLELWWASHEEVTVVDHLRIGALDAIRALSPLLISVYEVSLSLSRWQLSLLVVLGHLKAWKEANCRRLII